MGALLPSIPFPPERHRAIVGTEGDHFGVVEDESLCTSSVRYLPCYLTYVGGPNPPSK